MNQTILELQQKIGIKNPDGVWGKETYSAAKNYFNLTKDRAAHFFGQCAHESWNFTEFSENLHYSAERLKEVFPKYFPTDEIANNYANNPEKIASRVYANRMGNGDEASQDGWNFRGRGAIQTTGKYQYTLLSHHLNNPDIIKTPDIVSTNEAFESALFFFDQNGLWKICDGGVNLANVKKITKIINGGYDGLDDRMNKVKLFSTWN